MMNDLLWAVGGFAVASWIVAKTCKCADAARVVVDDIGDFAARAEVVFDDMLPDNFIQALPSGGPEASRLSSTSGGGNVSADISADCEACHV